MEAGPRPRWVDPESAAANMCADPSKVLPSRQSSVTFQTISPAHLPSAAGAAQADLGPLPEWNLSHLYPGMDSEAFKRDLAKAEAECKAFADAYRGTLDAMARGERASVRLDEVVKRYEALADLLRRLISDAGSVYYGDAHE